ncbi:MAG: hypothetical protein ACTSYR_05515 [Candidatus Odinarchaeia archaeon]
MAKDKAYGAAIFIVAILIIIGYTYWVMIIPFGWQFLPLGDTLHANYLWALAIPLWLAIVGILAIAAWIGYTMMTTPPPIPIEELEEEMEELEEEAESSS